MDCASNNFWCEIKDFKLMYCREYNMWFEIYVETDEGDHLVKNVTAKSLGEAELSQIKLYEIEINTETDISRDDYRATVLFNKIEAGASLLNRITEKAPHYKISHVDQSIANIQRTFSFDDISIYDAFQTIAEEINCLFIIEVSTDSNGDICREIKVYDLESYCLDCGNREEFNFVCPKCGGKNILSGYGKDTGIFISVDNLASDIQYSTDVDSVKNCFKLVGPEILAVCPEIGGRNNEGSLCSLDYTAESGWSWFLNDEHSLVGISDYMPADGDVIQFRFTVYGYGCDLGIDNTSWGGEPALVEAVKTADLAQTMANCVGTEKYSNAAAVLGTFGVSQEDIDAALAELNEEEDTAGASSPDTGVGGAAAVIGAALLAGAVLSVAKRR